MPARAASGVAVFFARTSPARRLGLSQMVCSHAPPRREFMSEMRELLDTELDAVSGGQPGYYGGHQALFEKMGLFDFGNTGNSNSGNIVNNIVNFFNFGNIVVEQNNTILQIGVAVGDNAS